MTERYVFRLFVTGQSPRSRNAAAILRDLCEDELRGRSEYTIIDVLEHPQLAEDERVLATPMLVKVLPLPSQRIIGDLSSRATLLLHLGLSHGGAEQRGDAK